MQDAVRPSKQAFKAMYERGFRTWHNLQKKALHDARGKHPSLSSILQADTALLSHPSFPKDLVLDKSFSNTVLAEGISTWRTAKSPCDSPGFDQKFYIHVASDRPVNINISQTKRQEFDLSKICGDDEDHIAVLILAWTYILSARWAEIIPGVAGPEYMNSLAEWTGRDISSEDYSDDSSKVVIELGYVDDDAARWWAAVLAPEGGWKTTILSDRGQVLHSPWHTKVASEQPLVLSREASSPPSPGYRPAASFGTALRFLWGYCEYHNVVEQSHAALAAALLLPVAQYENRIVNLPPPRAGHNLRSTTKQSPGIFSSIWTNLKYLDSLTTLSCNAVGVKSLLNSVFFERGVESNICGAFLQGTFEVLGSETMQDQNVLLRAMMKRDPGLSLLWLGAFITGAQTRALQEARRGWWKLDLNVAAWTGTLMSFIQEPVAGGRVEGEEEEEEISRADECRLLYMSHEQSYTVPPLFPFAPFGCIATKDTNIEVRQHVRCEARHSLEFKSLSWRCIENNTATSIPSPTPPLRPKNGYPVPKDISIPITYERLDDEDDDCSEMVTRNIFTWLRDEDGFPVAERDIREHEWIDNLNDDDDSPITGDTRSCTGGNLHGWLGKTVTWRSNSL
ncbi:hypothetical protein ONS95_014025 [Cadophora gregata]|uniref:uncharacterized protein n=1 Tax=Cadophora gregata TaxID=51156 RepID=UPI0026DBC064|nr:uncharacterized protein ONS95_014025 [Cadophora gregata]KAK0113775.1 hypothetical protein ONS96_014630 [Cadophora gregata f. sp. sojae]KAK0114535.1 hypothetical protein ONS95_014025 [Cadophora gregata]